MNTVLFKSRHALVSTIVVIGFWIWFGAASGRTSDRLFELSSGWGALALFLIVFAYVLRKYVHKLGISPEFKLRVPLERLEKAESRLAELRAQMTGGRVPTKAETLRRARAILRQERVHRVVKVTVVEGSTGELELLALPAGPLGSVAHWLRAHLYYGVAAAFLVAMHGRLDTHSGMSILLNGLSLLVILSGLVGIVLWAIVPGALTEAEHDLSIEKVHAMRESLDRKIAEVSAGLDPATRAAILDVDREDDGFKERAASAVASAKPAEEERRRAEDLLALLGQRRSIREEWRALVRIKRRMHLWRVVHVPGAVILMAVVMIHVLSVLWY